MNNLSLLNVWNSLELAKAGIHPYGGNIVEIYAQHFAPSSGNDRWNIASKRLYLMLDKFQECYGVNVFVNGKEVGNWLNSYSFFHKCDIRICDNESDQLARIRGGEKVQEDGEELVIFNELDAEKQDSNAAASKNVLSFLGSKESDKLIENLESCKITKQKKSTVPRLPVLLRNLWGAMSSSQNKKKAL